AAPAATSSAPALGGSFAVARIGIASGVIAGWPGLRDAFHGRNENRMLGRVQQLGRDLVRTDDLGGAVFLLAVSDGGGGADELFRFPLEIGEREQPRLSLDSAQRDALAEDIHAHDFLLAERCHYDLAFLGKTLAALDVEFVLITEATH